LGEVVTFTYRLLGLPLAPTDSASELRAAGCSVSRPSAHELASPHGTCFVSAALWRFGAVVSPVAAATLGMTVGFQLPLPMVTSARSARLSPGQ
jgi:hypothetical protein